MTFLTNIFLPTKENHYRAYLTYPILITIIYAIILTLLLISKIIPQNKLNILGTTDDLTPNPIISAINSERKDNNLTPLFVNEKLTTAAQNKAADMIKNGYWDHFSQTQKAPWDFLDDTGYTYIIAGENLAKGYYDAETLVAGWMNSPPHKANLLNPDYRDVGIAVVNGPFQKEKSTTLIVAIFASPLPSDLAKAVSTSNKDYFYLSPLLTESKNELVMLLSKYPSWLTPLFAIVSLIITLTLLIDRFYGQKLRTSLKSPSSHLWHH